MRKRLFGVLLAMSVFMATPAVFSQEFPREDDGDVTTECVEYCNQLGISPNCGICGIIDWKVVRRGIWIYHFECQRAIRTLDGEVVGCGLFHVDEWEGRACRFC